MPYRIEFTSAARRQLTKLAPDVKRRIVPVIDRLADDPRPSGVVGLKGTTHGYRVRVGDYRVLYEIDDDKLVLVVFRIGNRRQVYRGER